MNTEAVIETARLRLRRITRGDFAEIAAILGDREVMYAWGYAFSADQTRDWIAGMLARYEHDGCGYLAATLRDTGELVGLIGPLVERLEWREHMGIAYILAKAHWGRGYAIEGARACLDYAFATLGATSVIAEIRPENAASVAVARRLGMEKIGDFIKVHNGVEMLHDIYEKTTGGNAR